MAIVEITGRPRQIFVGKTTDTKPTGVTPGSRFFDDAGNQYITYDGTNWVKRIFPTS